MDDRENVEGIAKSVRGIEKTVNLNSDQVEVLRTIARTIARTTHKIFECSRCSRKFKIPNAKDGGIYKCISCNVVMGTVQEEKVQVVEANQAELVLDETLPPEVQQAFKNPENIFGRFILVSKLGEGAMGAVYRAFDVELGRFVALKFIKSQQAEELRAEARTLAGLEHKNIARIYDIGSAKGVGFIAMQFVTGRQLSAVKFQQGDALRVMIAVCEAVDYAHKRGVIHRDIKPENVMMDEDGNVYVMDFGLAVKNPQEGEVAGTPGYMAPEVAVGKPATAQTDIYSLGATLYHLLAKRPPIDITKDDTLETVLERIKIGELIPIRQVISEISPELEAIVNKAMHQSAGGRYQSAFEMAQDIQALKTCHPVSAYSGSVAYRFRKAVLRNKIFSATVVVASIVIGIIALVAYTKYKENQSVEEERKKAEEASAQAAEFVRKLIDAILTDLSTRHEEALQRRRSGETYENLSRIPRRILDSEVYKQGRGDAEKNPKVRYSLGKLYRTIGDHENALKEQLAAIAIDPNFGKALYELSILYQREYSHVIEELRIEWRIRESEKRYVESHGDPGTSVLRRPPDEQLETPAVTDVRKKAIDYLTRAMANLEKGSEELATAKGIEAMRNRKYDDAKKKFALVLEKDKAAEDAVETLASIFSFEGKYEDAIKVLSDALEIDRGNIIFFFNRAECFQDIVYDTAERKLDPIICLQNSVKDYESVLSIHKDRFLALVRAGGTLNDLAMVEMDSGKPPENTFKRALKHLDRAVEVEPHFDEAWLRRGQTLVNYGIWKHKSGKNPSAEFERAEEDFSKGLELDSKNDMLWLAIGNLWLNKGYYLQTIGKEPESCFERALNSYTAGLKVCSPNYTISEARGSAWMLFGNYKISVGQPPDKEYDQAIKDFSDSIEIDKSKFSGWLARAKAWNNWCIYKAQLGKTPEVEYSNSLADHNAAIKVEPHYYDSYMSRGGLYMNWGNFLIRWKKDPVENFRLASLDYDQAVELNKLSADVWLGRAKLFQNWAKFLKENGQNTEDEFENAFRDFDKSIELNKNNFDAWLERGATHMSYASHLSKQGKEPWDELKKAETDFNAAMTINSGIGMVWRYKGNLYNNRALVYEERKEFLKAAADYDSAVAHWKKAITLNPALEKDLRSPIDNAEKWGEAMRVKAKENKEY